MDRYCGYIILELQDTDFIGSAELLLEESIGQSSIEEAVI
jgi:hypothetical protein